MTTTLYCFTTGDTVNKLFPHEYNYRDYVLTLVEIEGRIPRTSVSKPLYLCCDIIEDSYISRGAEQLPLKEKILKQIIGRPSGIKWEGNNQNFFKLKHSAIKNIRLYVIDDTGDVVKNENIFIRCTLELRPTS